MKKSGGFLLTSVLALAAISLIAWCLTMATVVAAPHAVEAIFGSLSAEMPQSVSQPGITGSLNGSGVFFYLWGTLVLLLFAAPIAFAYAYRVLVKK